MYIWCIDCKEYRKYGSDQWWKCTQTKHNMHSANEQFNAEVKEQKRLIEDGKEMGMIDEGASGRLGVLMAIQKSDADPKTAVERAALILHESVEKYSITEHDDGLVYFWIKRGDKSYDALPHDSEKLARFVIREYDRRYTKTLSRAAAEQAIGRYAAKGDVPGNIIRDAGKRIIKVGNTVWIDLRDDQNSIYRVTPEHCGPSYPYNPGMDILFDRDGGAVMPLPKRKEGNWLEWFAGLLRMPEDMKMLFAVHVCHMLCVWHETPFALFVGPEGSGKTVTASMVKELVDPTGLNSTSNSLPKDEDRLAMVLTKEQVQLFDNVSYIPMPVSDMLCKACTGGVHRVRELYTTNNVRRIPFYKMRIFLTSVMNDVVRAPDLASRVLRYDVPPGQTDKSKDNLEEEYVRNRPHMLYAALDAVGKAMKEYESRKEYYSNLPTTTRMVDFERFGSAIAYVLGDKEHTSIKKYQEIMQDNMTMMMADEPMVRLIEKLLETDDTNEYFNLTSIFYARIRELAETDDGIDIKGKDFPQTLMSARKHIDRLKGVLLKRGIEVTIGKRHDPEAKQKHRSHITIHRQKT